MTKYKAGDKVTFVLDRSDAIILNKGDVSTFVAKQIVHHEPAPEAEIFYTNFYKNRKGEYYSGSVYKIKDDADFASVGRAHILKTTIHPDGRVETEVLK